MPTDSCSFRLLDDTLTSIKIDIIEGLNIGIIGSVHLMALMEIMDSIQIDSCKGLGG